MMHRIIRGVGAGAGVCSGAPQLARGACYVQLFSLSGFTHVDVDSQQPRMVDVSSKNVTSRTAHARCYVHLPPIVVEKLQTDPNSMELLSKKGPILATSVIGGVMAAKKTSDLIPFCHPIPLDGCDITITFDEEKKNSLRIDCVAKTQSKTGVEMEAFVGATNSALCIYDMCKAVSHDIRITDVHLVRKTGGKSDFESTNSGSPSN